MLLRKLYRERGRTMNKPKCDCGSETFETFNSYTERFDYMCPTHGLVLQVWHDEDVHINDKELAQDQVERWADSSLRNDE